MNTRRLTAAMLCQSIVLAGCVVAWPAAFGLAGADSTGAAAPPTDASASPPVVDTKSEARQIAAAHDGAADAPQLSATENRAVGSAEPADAARVVTTGTVDVATVSETVPATASGAMTADETTASIPPLAADRPAAGIQTASADPSEMLPTDTSTEQAIAATPQDRAQQPSISTVSSVEILDECYVMDACVDRYLWALYQRTPKEDSIKLTDRRAVTVKRKHRMVTVMRTFTRLADEDFAWKDPKAADRAGLSMMDYVIGGMDRSFKLKLFHTLLAAEAAGLSPGITSAFRDDYRQAIATGLKAANDRSYHGGSFRGGYGHGLAADIVSVKGTTRAQRWASTEVFWKWIDAHGKEFGIARPYLGRDPPHVGPIDGQEYASKRGGGSTRHAAADLRTRRLVMRVDHGAARRAARASKASAIRSARNAPSRTIKLHG